MSDLIIGRSGMKTCQIKEELDGMVNLMKEKNVKKYLEIGARYGDSFYYVMKNLPKGSLGVCVDLPNHLWGNENSSRYLLEACDELKNEGYLIKCILGNSTYPEIIAQVFEFSDYYDFCLIDGDHTYKGVKADYLNFSEKSGFVAFHDIVGHGQRHSEGIFVEVPILWNELKKEKTFTQEFISKGSKMGIGVCNG